MEGEGGGRKREEKGRGEKGKGGEESVVESKKSLKQTLNSANKGKFYRAFNSIFRKIGRIASEEVIFALIKSKCLSILLCGTEACPTNSAVRHSLDFAFNKCHNIKKHKLARNQCQEMADEKEMF